METGVIFDIKKYAIHDGPGIRTTVFFKGCPLSCWWCHNPEGLTMSTQRLYIKERCIGCGECIKCRTCAQACPSEAIEFIGKTSTVDDVVRKIERDIIFYDESNGGVTFSGGEPLMQPGF
ncbi:MAG: 4Fe-4S cluster-binding domain-containing protein, partial [Deltaproteobacteria bacterium]|nr:4Fe-4S cluster-binding domain-containing protein [Deltaproteobacteria bacterium]